MMLETTIVESEGFLGLNVPRLKLGESQCMVFTSNDKGPWYLQSDEERESRRYSRPTGCSKRIERTQKLLVNALEVAGVTLQQQLNHTKKGRQDFARTNGVDLFDNKQEMGRTTKRPSAGPMGTRVD